MKDGDNVKLEVVRIGLKYQHSKGGVYKVVGTCKHSETLEEMVLYQAIDKNDVWCRPREMFCDGRFKLIERCEVCDDEGEVYLYLVNHKDKQVDFDWKYCDRCYPNNSYTIPNGFDEITHEEFQKLIEDGYENLNM